MPGQYMYAASGLPSPLKSAVMEGSPPGPVIAGPSTSGSAEQSTVHPVIAIGAATGKLIALDVKPEPPFGLTTVTAAVPAEAMSEARMSAVNCELVTNVVARELLFQFTTAPGTNPVPFTVRVKPGPPGAVEAGTSG